MNEIIDSLYSITIRIGSHIFLEPIPTHPLPTFLISYLCSCLSGTRVLAFNWYSCACVHRVPVLIQFLHNCVNLVPTLIPYRLCSSGTFAHLVLPMFIQYQTLVFSFYGSSELSSMTQRQPMVKFHTFYGNQDMLHHSCIFCHEHEAKKANCIFLQWFDHIF